MSLCVIDSIVEGVGNVDVITAAFQNVLSLLTSGITFLTGNTWLMILVAAPIVFGILAALLSIFKH